MSVSMISTLTIDQICNRGTDLLMSPEDIQKVADNAKERAVKNFAEKLCEGRVENDPVVIAVNSLLVQMKEVGE